MTSTKDGSICTGQIWHLRYGCAKDLLARVEEVGTDPLEGNEMIIYNSFPLGGDTPLWVSSKSDFLEMYILKEEPSWRR